MDRDQLLKEILELMNNDSDFPNFDKLEIDTDGSATFKIGDKEFMLMVIDITE